jgi:hypothetical protein
LLVTGAMLGVVASVAAAPSTIRISGERGGTTFTQASSALRAPWERPGGDFVDANGVRNGPSPHASEKVDRAGATVSFDISGMDGDLLLRFEGGPSPAWSAPRIDGAPAEAFWVDGTANRPLGAPLHMPAFVRNPGRGSTLSIEIDNIYRPGRVLLDPVAEPRVPSIAMVKGGMAATVARDAALAQNGRVIRYLELKDEASLYRAIPRSGIAEPFALEPQWVTGPRGLRALRFSSAATAQRLISWFLRFEPREEVYARYCVYLEDDIADGMTELGVKLPGLAGDGVSWRMEHGPVAPGNRGLYAALDYLYNAESGAGYGNIRSMNTMFRAGRWYVIEQYVKLNTVGAANGIGKVWINGSLMWSSSTVRWRSKPESRMNMLHVNVYHGGMGLPKAPIHYRIAAIVVAGAYIGPPPELIDATGR